MPFPPEQQLRQIGPALDCLLALLDGDGMSDTPVGARPSIAMRVRAVIDAVLPARLDAAVAERLKPAMKSASARQRAVIASLRDELQRLNDQRDADCAAVAASLGALSDAIDNLAAKIEQPKSPAVISDE